jgi:hypothetical protein
VKAALARVLRQVADRISPEGRALDEEQVAAAVRSYLRKGGRL